MRSWRRGRDGIGLRVFRSIAFATPPACCCSFRLDDRPHLVLTVRAAHPRPPRRTGSLPGGVIETGETPNRPPFARLMKKSGSLAGRERLGVLSPIDIPVSGFRLHPVVAAVRGHPVLKPADGEVARIIEPRLARLMDPGASPGGPSPREDQTLDFPVFLAEGVEIWGATAMVLAEFRPLLGWTGPNRSDPKSLQIAQETTYRRADFTPNLTKLTSFSCRYCTA